MATRSCPVCAHERRKELEATLASGQDPLVIAEAFAVTLRQLTKHAACGSATPAKASPAKRARAARSGAASSSVAGNPLPAAAPLSDAAPLRAAPACKVCASAMRADVEAALATGEVPSAIARRFFLEPSDIRAHVAELAAARPAPAPTPAAPAREAEDPGPELPPNASALQHARAQVARCRGRRARLQRENAELYQISAAEKDEASATRLLLQCEAARDISEADVLASAAWRRIERVLVEAAAPFPDAVAAVARALQALDQPDEAAA